MRRILGVLAFSTAAASALAGAWALKWYLWDIVIGTAGEPDRSMLFWGLPVVMLGGLALSMAVLLAWLGKRALVGRAVRRPPPGSPL